MDIYRSYLRPKAGQSELVRTGRWASFISLLIAVCIAPLLSGLDQAFHYIQEFTGFVSPGALAIFLAGFFIGEQRQMERFRRHWVHLCSLLY